MGIIPFILNDSGKTIVKSRQEFDSLGGLNGKVILIQELDIDQIRNTQSSNASYDLRVGSEYQDHRDTGSTNLPDNGKITLQPGAAVIIETMESVQFPKSRFGHIVPKVSLLQHGLSNTSSKIDPGYSGRLLITVFNLGKRTTYLKKGQTFCTLYVIDVDEGIIAYEKQGKRLRGDSREGFFRITKDFIETNQAYFTVILTIATIVLTLIELL